MFERFTGAARRVIILAWQEAGGLKRTLGWTRASPGSEHLRFGILRHGVGMAAQALVAAGIDLDIARRTVSELIDRGRAADSVG